MFMCAILEWTNKKRHAILELWSQEKKKSKGREVYESGQNYGKRCGLIKFKGKDRINFIKSY